MPGVYGSHFRRVTFGDDRRAGLLGHGSILTVTSYATRTSPVLRGKWLLENLLGAPPPAPPADVPPLPEAGGHGEPRSVRERMEQHRASPVCASCHKMMDPLGFALENFDAIGAWRAVAGNDAPIDTSGELPDGTRFETLADFRQVLGSRQEAFVTTVTKKASHVRPRPGAHPPRCSGCPPNRQGCRGRRLLLVVSYAGDREEHAVSDEEIGVMIITKKAIPRRAVLRDLARRSPCRC